MTKYERIINKLLKSKMAKANAAWTKNHINTIDGVRYNVFTDTHRMLLDRFDDYGLEAAPDPINAKNFIIAHQAPKRADLVCIDVAAVKEYKKTDDYKKNKKPYIIDFDGVLKVGIDPNYLLDALAFCDTKILQITDRNNKAPLYFHNDNNSRMAIVCPVYIK